MGMEWDDEDERLKDVIRSILVQKAPIFAGLKDGFVVHYLSDVLLGQYQFRTQLDATLRGVLVVDQLVHVAILDECKIFLRLLVLEEVDPERSSLDQFSLGADHFGDELLVESVLRVTPFPTSGQVDRSFLGR